MQDVKQEATDDLVAAFGWVAQELEIFPSLYGGGEPHGGPASGPVGRGGGQSPVPAPGGAAAQHARPPVRRRAAAAGGPGEPGPADRAKPERSDGLTAPPASAISLR